MEHKNRHVDTQTNRIGSFFHEKKIQTALILSGVLAFALLCSMGTQKEEVPEVYSWWQGGGCPEGLEQLPIVNKTESSGPLSVFFLVGDKEDLFWVATHIDSQGAPLTKENPPKNAQLAFGEYVTDSRDPDEGEFFYETGRHGDLIAVNNQTGEKGGISAVCKGELPNRP